MHGLTISGRKAIRSRLGRSALSILCLLLFVGLMVLVSRTMRPPQSADFKEDAQLDRLRNLSDLKDFKYYEDFTIQNINDPEEGIPVFEYGSGRYPHPVQTAIFGLAAFDRCVDFGRQADREKVIRSADWFVANQRKHANGSGVWYYDFDYNDSETVLKAPWVSGLAQGQAVSLLTRAFRLTGNKAYLAAATKGFESFTRSASDPNWIIRQDARDFWIEEYPQPKATHVLNGNIYALFGILDYYRVTGDPRALALWRKGIASLKRHLPEYDAGSWSLYDQRLTKPDKHFFYLSSPSTKTVTLPVVEIRLRNAIGQQVVYGMDKMQGAKDATDPIAASDPYLGWGGLSLLGKRVARIALVNNTDPAGWEGAWVALFVKPSFLIPRNTKLKVTVVYQDTTAESIWFSAFNAMGYDLGRLSNAGSGALRKDTFLVDSRLFLGRSAGGYHDNHLIQLRALYQITGDPFFKDYYAKWKAYGWHIGPSFNLYLSLSDRLAEVSVRDLTFINSRGDTLGQAESGQVTLKGGHFRTVGFSFTQAQLQRLVTGGPILLKFEYRLKPGKRVRDRRLEIDFITFDRFRKVKKLGSLNLAPSDDWQEVNLQIGPNLLQQLRNVSKSPVYYRFESAGEMLPQKDGIAGRKD